jgi:hypothetical protein
MRHPSPNDIAEMKTRGFDPSTIRDAEERSKRWHEAQRVIQAIRTAFAGVALGSGVGLYQAQGLDDYASEAELERLRSKDEKEDWARISADALNECYSSLSFFDPEGMRFHIPAYLIADLDGEYKHGMAFTLCNPRDQFTKLSAQQSAAVRLYLQYIVAEDDYDFDRPHIVRALEECWFK